MSPVPRVYFDVRDGLRFTPDNVGLMFSDIEAAKVEATRALAEIAKDVLPAAFVREMAIEVRDEHKEPCCAPSSGSRSSGFGAKGAPQWAALSQGHVRFELRRQLLSSRQPMELWRGLAASLLVSRVLDLHPSRAPAGPSCFSSCSQPSPAGTFVSSTGRAGRMKPGGRRRSRANAST